MNHSYIEKILKGDRVAIARSISMVENEHPESLDLLKSIYPKTGNAYRIGITGPPGAGKSTITNKLAKYFRSEKKRVGIIAVDPTSPFTGGALLGDRVRMTDVDLDEGVFIRSMASRGSLGGLSKKAKEAADVLDASGCDIILLETVGVGQSELDIARAADTTIVVLVPESGDSIQAMKAGLMEIADFFVLNKSDRAGAEQAVMSIKMVLNFKPKHDGWMPDVIQTTASEGKGIVEVAKKIAEHSTYLVNSKLLGQKRANRIIEQIRESIGERLHIEFWNEERNQILNQKIEDVIAFKETPFDLVEYLLKNYKK
ncbi:MAG: methylmalonyl Co-A mutase-associated GTPase MeaB [Ignavibacteriales bacterium]|nr:methylmalonyl Co-A mutase-associated GTPase MeaB [Ignavibacteriales bacterium]